MLLYLVKHLCPNHANVTRELSKANNGANPAAYKKLLCVIKYVLDMKNLGLKIEPKGNSNKPWEIICFSNSKYTGEPGSRWCISRFILYIFNLPVSWQSKSQKIVSLSSSEVDYIALSEAVKEVMYMIQLLGSMTILLKYPVTIRVDNVGAIFMASKHNNIRYKYVNDYVKDGVVEINFVKSDNNQSNILTKNFQCPAS